MSEYRVRITRIDKNETNTILFIKNIEFLTALIQIMDGNYCMYELTIEPEEN